MNDLISREALHRDIENIRARYGNDNSSLIEQGEVLDLIAEAPTVDAAEVVRCGECKYWVSPDKDDAHYCNQEYGLYGIVAEEDFCSYGERKDDNK